MADPLQGKVEIQDKKAKAVFKVDPDISPIKFEILNDIIEIDANGGITAGGGGKDGKVAVKSAAGHPVAGVNAEDASVWCGGSGRDGRIAAMGAGGVVMMLEASTGLIAAGGAGKHGALALKTGDGKSRVRLNGGTAECLLGGNGSGGVVALFSAAASTPAAPGSATIEMHGQHGRIRVGGNSAHGNLALYRADAVDMVQTGKATIDLRAYDAVIRVGGAGQDGDVMVCNAKGSTMVHVNGQTGDIALQNADCAEEFDVSDSQAGPGTVLVLGDDGKLCTSGTAYDTRVAGIVSGAGDYRPALVLDRKPGREGRRAVALAGKVCCKVEANSAPIRVGTLLTTSSMPGHAMAATERDRAFGAVIGKALAPLDAGVGMVPVLVALQ